MRVVGSPLYKSSGDVSSCIVLEDVTEKTMGPDFLKSWVHVVAASVEGSSSPPLLTTSGSARKLAHGSFDPKLRRSASGGESYRSFLARMFLGLGRAPLFPPSTSRSTISTSGLTQPCSSHFQARSLLSGQVAVDSTVKIGDNNNNNNILPLTTTENPSRQNSTPHKRLIRTAKRKVTNFQSLGVFDFPSSHTRNQLLKKRVLKNKSNHNISSKSGAGTTTAVVKNLGIFNFDSRSEINAVSSSTSSSSSPIHTKPRCKVVVKTVQSNYTVQLDYWQDLVAKLSSLYGEHHSRTRQARMALGNTYLKWGDYALALELFQSILQQLNQKPQCLVAACVLEKIGCALAHQDQKQQQTKEHVQEALLIRYQHLGPLHVDTVETLNVLASLYFKWEELEDARETFAEVLVLRQAMFGSQHPSVAVTAQELGQVHAKLEETDKARHYYWQAKQIYERLRIPQTNPSVVSVLKDLQALDGQ